jgi:hypothetical protein
MITPREQATLDRLISTNPHFKTLVDKFQLEPVPSQSYRRSLAISAKVDEIIHAVTKAQNSPQVERTILRTVENSSCRDIYDLSAEIKVYLQAIYGPQPWKYPLPHAPF